MADFIWGRLCGLIFLADRQCIPICEARAVIVSDQIPNKDSKTESRFNGTAEEPVHKEACIFTGIFQQPGNGFLSELLFPLLSWFPYEHFLEIGVRPFHCSLALIGVEPAVAKVPVHAPKMKNEKGKALTSIFLLSSPHWPIKKSSYFGEISPFIRSPVG